nr:type II secretion system F family protein [Candidatus Wallbacteria bacterium]
KYGKRFMDGVKLNLPMVSPLIIQYNITNFVKSTSLMFFSGYTFLNSMREASNTVDNVELSDDLNHICERIENGQSIYEAFKKGKYIPTFTISMLRVGEKSNNLYEMLENIVYFNEQELDYATNTFLRMMGPFIIVILALVVGSILFAAYLPVLSMARLIKV